jgi:hypothetical protein
MPRPEAVLAVPQGAVSNVASAVNGAVTLIAIT